MNLKNASIYIAMSRNEQNQKFKPDAKSSPAQTTKSLGLRIGWLYHLQRDEASQKWVS